MTAQATDISSMQTHLDLSLLERESLDADRSLPEEAAGPTVEEFVRRAFVPEHVATKQLAGQMHYRAMLKHVIHPEDVDRIFGGAWASSRSKLKGVPGWPYVGSLPLSDVRPDHVQRLIAAAMAHGYSTQTVAHIRRVTSAIFICARRRGLFGGENPAAVAAGPEIVHNRAHVLTLHQTRAALQAMRYPEKEMALIALLTGMNLAEICGLQWKFVNMTSSLRTLDDELIAPRTISVRNTWRRGELVNWTRRNHNASVEITDALLTVLASLSSRKECTGPDDFVLASPTGKPLSQRYIAVRRLKAIGDSIGAPWLSWQVLRRTRMHLIRQFGLEFQRLVLPPTSGSSFREPAEGAASEAAGSQSCSQPPGRWLLAAVVRAIGLGKLWQQWRPSPAPLDVAPHPLASPLPEHIPASLRGSRFAVEPAGRGFQSHESKAFSPRRGVGEVPAASTPAG